MRLAWFTPLPPIRSGIASYNTELLARLRGAYEIDVFVEDPDVASEATLPVLRRVPGSLDILNAHDFLWRHLQHPYDLIVYQLGNAVCHDYMWAYMTRFPGLVVLHDAQLHHACARSLLTLERPDDYRAEFSFSHAGVPAPIVELGISGHLGRLNYLWPMLGIMFATARGVAVHNSRVATDLREEFPGRPIFPITLGIPDSDPGDPDQARAQIRWQHQIPDEAVVFVMLGGVTPEKRVPVLLNAVARAASEGLEVYALLVGETVAHYDARADAKTLRDRQSRQDCRICRRQERATVPGGGGRFASVCDGQRDVRRHHRGSSVCRPGVPVSSPISRIRLTFRRSILARGPHFVDQLPAIPCAFRSTSSTKTTHCTLPSHVSPTTWRSAAALGRRAREHWRAHHSMDRMVEDYLRLLTTAAALPDPPMSPELPYHLRTDGTELARALLVEAGVSVDFWPRRRGEHV